MKKVIKIMFFAIVFFLLISNVNAAEITIDEVINKFKNSELYTYLNSDKTTLAITKTDTDVQVSYSYIEVEGGCYENKDGICITPGEGVELIPPEDYTYIDVKTTIKSFDTFLNYKEGILSYSAVYKDKTNIAEDEIESTLIESLIIFQMLENILELNGISEDEKAILTEGMLETFTFENNGIELKTFDYRYEEDGSTISGTAVESLKVDLSNIRLNINANNSTEDKNNENNIDQNDQITENNNQLLDNTENNKNNTKEETQIDQEEVIENPQTGNVIPYVIIIIGLISIIGLYYYSKKTNRMFKI